MAELQGPSPLLKFTVQHYKDPNVSDEAFMKWYQEEHRPRMEKLVHKHKVDRYALVGPLKFRALAPCLFY